MTPLFFEKRWTPSGLPVNSVWTQTKFDTKQIITELSVVSYPGRKMRKNHIRKKMMPNAMILVLPDRQEHQCAGLDRLNGIGP